MTEALALVAHQPWPSLILMGEKHWETRTRSMLRDQSPALPGFRVDPLTKLGIASAVCAPEPGLEVGPWKVDRASRDDGVPHTISRDPVPKRSSRFPSIEIPTVTWSYLPLGTMVCTVTVTEVLPILDAAFGWTGGGDTPDRAIVVDHIRDELLLVTETDVVDISDQLPYGNWQHGSFAARLSTPVAVTPVPYEVVAGNRQGVFRARWVDL